MRYLLLSDIHANIEALEAVLESCTGEYDEILNCGDIVGYGPDPNAVTEWCRQHTPDVIRGNHDKAAVGLADLEWFNPVARRAAVWTAERLTEENRKYLVALPQGPRIIGDSPGFSLVHGSPRDEDDYVFELDEVEAAAPFIDRALTFFGHTHMQGGFMIHRNGILVLRGPVIALENDVAYLLNPGSVGQPRDGDPRAAYALYDTDERTVEFRRAVYDVAATQRKMIQAGLPEPLAQRLEQGR